MSGVLIGAAAFGLAAVAWPASRWVGSLADLASPHLLVPIAFANAVVIIGIYFAFAALTWGIADAAMAQPRDLFSFATCSEDGRKWRVAHLSDIHVVGERYGFRVESGRSGPQGNERLALAMAKLDAIHATNPLDLVLITGDITDAGRSAEWAEFFGALVQYPRIASLVLALPGNHDLNVVDRANPARLDLPMIPKKRLRAGPHDVCALGHPGRQCSHSRQRDTATRTDAGENAGHHTRPRSQPSQIRVRSAFRFLSRSCGRSCSRWSSHRIQRMDWG